MLYLRTCVIEHVLIFKISLLVLCALRKHDAFRLETGKPHSCVERPARAVVV
jgi:hypothetical protein